MADVYVCAKHGESESCEQCRSESEDNQTDNQPALQPPERIWIQPIEGTLLGVGPIWFTRRTSESDVEYARVTRFYFCSCGGALTAEEYVEHVFERGHDRGIR